jgi:iron-sulfur cluster repair protein YtfE (RIC family)
MEKLNPSEIVDIIIKEFHDPLREILPELWDLMNKIENEYNSNSIWLAKEIFKQLQYEAVRHIDREDNNFFPNIKELENWRLKDFTVIERYLTLQKIEHHEIDNYIIPWRDIVKKICTDEKNETFIRFKELSEILFVAIQQVIYIENVILDRKIEDLLEKTQ